ncbi:uncharacterized protein RCO7_10334 [Rhynchosporium graminicola]|uniref:Uncharacterized protein n=1 Tax=Rhynchosporium graminicola TaxID=2792576 RepID=A0A1E1K863_9HELO|nr:uncharacterized protein RCO7_10334 [Rhynchosporium commune]
MPDASTEYPAKSAEQSVTKFQLPRLKENINKVIRQYNEAGIPEFPRKIHLSLSSVCGSPNTAQTSPKSSPPSLAPGTESSGIKRSAIFQSPTAQLAVYTSSSVLDNNQDIGALDFGQRIVATSGASNFSRKRKRVTPPNETESDPTAGSDISSDHPSFTGTQEQQVIENASLLRIAKVFDEYMCSAIRRVTIQSDLKAAVTTVLPVWGGPVDCLISLDVYEREVEQLAIALFNAKVKWVEQVLHVILKEGITLIIPHSETTLKGVLDKAIIKVFGSEIHHAITESPGYYQFIARIKRGSSNTEQAI